MLSESLFQGLEDGDVDRPDLRGSWVFIVPGLVWSSELVDASGAIQLGIGEVQLGKLLAHDV